MITILFGDEPVLIEQKLNSIISKNKNALLTKFNGQNKDFDIDLLVDSCKSVGLFNEQALVLVKDPYFLIKKVEDNEILPILEYCKNPLYETDLVFYTLENQFNEKLKTFKDISNNSEVIKLNQLPKDEFYTYAKRYINSLKINITKEAVDYLLNNVNLSISLLTSNLEVLSIYPDKIDLEAAKKLITLANVDDVFSLINALTSKQVSLAIKYANRLLENDESTLRLISSLAAQLRFLYSVGYYRSLNKTRKEIMNILNVKSSYRIDKAYESLTKIDMEQIEQLLSRLCDLDYDLKKNDDMDEKLKLELFIINLLK